jgi:pyridoxal phosphate enzyme (YggS family)
MPVRENLSKIRANIAGVGSNSQDIELVAVTKGVPIDIIEEAILAGVTDIGENRIQEAAPKIEYLRPKYPQVKFHFIGHLQTNKVRQALDLFDIIQSLDSERLARELSARAARHIPVLVEVNTSGEQSKFGVPVEETLAFMHSVARLPNLKVEGLMTIAPLASDPRPSFKKLKILRDQILKLNLPTVAMKYLSMGMSDDYQIAIQEGANMVRLGRLIFGLPTGRQDQGVD